MKLEITAENDSRIITALLAVSVFFLPIFQIPSLICWIILLLYGILAKNFSNFIADFKSSPFYILLVSLYLFYLVGMIWTENTALGWEDLKVKIPLFLFPFLFLLIPIIKSFYYVLCRSLIFGCLTAVFFCSVRAFMHYRVNHNLQEFYYTSFSRFLHPTYFTMYINLAMLFLMQFILDNTVVSKKVKWYDVFLLFLFSAVVIVLTARIAMITTLITLSAYTILELRKRKIVSKFLKELLVGAIIIGVMFFYLVKVNNRFTQISEVIEKYENNTELVDTVNNTGYNSTTIRIGLLKNGMELFKENPIFGVGTGDLIPESVNCLNRQGLHMLAQKSRGPHNQYLQVAVTLGIFGFFLFVLCIGWPFIEYLRAKEYLFAAFMVIVMFNAVGDTVLRASSIYFFTMFGCFFYRNFRSFKVKKVQKSF